MNLRADYIKQTEYTSPPFDDIEMYAGIVDDQGIDQLHTKENLSNAMVDMMRLRCRTNSHRNARVFICSIKKKYVQDFKDIEPIKLYELLKKISIQFVEEE